MSKPTTPTSSSCDPILLQQSLGVSLSEQQEEQLAGHLAECGHCREQLQALAGSHADWSRIVAALQVEQTVVDGVVDPDVESLSGDRFIADFAVDFLEPTTDADALGRLGAITIREVIGHGGNGIVLKGFQPELNRLVAAKVMAPHLATSAAARRRFAREAQATAAIVHPSVMPVLSVNSAGRLPYLVMPYVDCESLQQRIDQVGSLPLIDVLRIGVQVARGLAAAHAQGLVHRDVKPANILLEKGVDRVMLTDFGLARAIDDASLTRSGLIAGTPQYMSPEQARGDAVDTRSDLFSLGSVLYAMSTGRPPFRAESSYGILRRVTDDEPRSACELNTDVPAWLETLLKKLLSKLPDDRYTSADELADLLEECVAHVQQPAANPLPQAVHEVSNRTGGPIFHQVLLVVLVLTIGIGLVAALLPASDTPGPGRARSTANASPVEQDLPMPMEVLSGPDDVWAPEAGRLLMDLDDEIDQLMREVNSDFVFQAREVPSSDPNGDLP